MSTCQAILRDGRPCPYKAQPGQDPCGIHRSVGKRGIATVIEAGTVKVVQGAEVTNAAAAVYEGLHAVVQYWPDIMNALSHFMSFVTEYSSGQEIVLDMERKAARIQQIVDAMRKARTDSDFEKACIEFKRFADGPLLLVRNMAKNLDRTPPISKPVSFGPRAKTLDHSTEFSEGSMRNPSWRGAVEHLVLVSNSYDSAVGELDSKQD